VRFFPSWAIASAATALSACSLLTDLSGLAGPAGSEAGADAAESGTLEASVPVEASFAVDASADGGFCERMNRDASAILCIDFDNGDLGGTPQIDNETSVVLDDASAVSPPNALVTTVRPAARAVCAYATSTRTVSEDAIRVRLDYDLLFGRPGGGALPTASASVFGGAEVTLASTAGTGECFYYLKLGTTSAALVSESVADGQLTRPLAEKIAAGVWTHVTTIIEGPSSPPLMSVLLDGKLVLDKAPASTTCTVGRVRNLINGLQCVSSEFVSDIEIRVDNVLLQRLD
jgi:hypothetical protein